MWRVASSASLVAALLLLASASGGRASSASASSCAVGDRCPRQKVQARRAATASDSALLQVWSAPSAVEASEDEALRAALERERPLARCLVVTELANTPRHRNQFQAVFHPSWRQMVDDPHPGNYTVDLMAFCEPAACDIVPAECVELAEMASPSRLGPARCYFQRLPETYEKSVPYKFGLSLNFMTTTAFAAVAKSYDYIMRSDADAVLLPGLRHWVPEHGSAVGDGFAGTDFTYHRLEKIAKKLGFRHHGVHGMQSTFYVRAGKIGSFSGMLVNLSNHFYDEEFTPLICEEVKRQGGKCEWADWYRLVSTLYATDIAANHLLGEPTFSRQQVSEKLDHCATSCYSKEYGDNGFLAASPYKARNVAQVHLLSTKHHLSKHFLTAGSREEFCASAKEIWPSLRVRTQDWGSADESVNTYFLRVLSGSLPKMCTA